jgi:DNA-binding NarL/FixJ family response regulator
MTSVLIVDDHPLFREGVKALIKNEKKFDIVGEADNGSDAIRKVKKLKPRLVLMDLSLPDKNGYEVAREIKGAAPETFIIMLTMHSMIDNVIDAFKAGATGYVVKDAASDHLLKAIEAVMKGEYFMDAAISRQVVDRLMRQSGKKTAITDEAYETLTPREKEIMALLADGNRAKTIADQLCISPKTVENHRCNIMRKLDVHSSHELVKYAARIGLIDIEQWKK